MTYTFKFNASVGNEPGNSSLQQGSLSIEAEVFDNIDGEDPNKYEVVRKPVVWTEEDVVKQITVDETTMTLLLTEDKDYLFRVAYERCYGIDANLTLTYDSFSKSGLNAAN